MEDNDGSVISDSKGDRKRSSASEFEEKQIIQEVMTGRKYDDVAKKDFLGLSEVVDYNKAVSKRKKKQRKSAKLSDIDILSAASDVSMDKSRVLGEVEERGSRKRKVEVASSSSGKFVVEDMPSTKKSKGLSAPTGEFCNSTWKL